MATQNGSRTRRWRRAPRVCTGLGASLLIVGSASAGQCDIGSLTIDEPVAGALIPWSEPEPTVRVCGRFDSPWPVFGWVDLRVESTAENLDCDAVSCSFEPEIIDGRWCQEGVVLGWAAPTRLTAKHGQCTDSIYLTCCTSGLSPRGTQTFGLRWEGVGGLLRQIARDTLSNVGEGPEAEFPGKVRKRVQELLSEWSAPFDMSLVEPGEAIDPEADEPYKIRFTSTDDAFWGWTDEEHSDCGNTVLTGESTVHVGTFADSMKREPRRWSPMAKKDLYKTRVEDLAQALASTAFHELMHGIGLVNCDWMSEDSSDEGHNDPALHAGARGHPFGGGWHLLDSGLCTLGHQMLGFDAFGPQAREVRKQRVLGPTNVRYLEVLHPGME